MLTLRSPTCVDLPGFSRARQAGLPSGTPTALRGRRPRLRAHCGRSRRARGPALLAPLLGRIRHAIAFGPRKLHLPADGTAHRQRRRGKLVYMLRRHGPPGTPFAEVDPTKIRDLDKARGTSGDGRLNRRLCGRVRIVVPQVVFPLRRAKVKRRRQPVVPGTPIDREAAQTAIDRQNPHISRVGSLAVEPLAAVNTHQTHTDAVRAEGKIPHHLQVLDRRADLGAKEAVGIFLHRVDFAAARAIRQNARNGMPRVRRAGMAGVAIRQGALGMALDSVRNRSGDLALGGEGMAVVEKSFDWHALCSFLKTKCAKTKCGTGTAPRSRYPNYRESPEYARLDASR